MRSGDVMTPRFSVVFQRLVCLGSFPACWRQANVTTIPKGPPFSSVANYRLISITSVLSTVFERHGVGSSWTICGMQWCAFNHPVWLSERSVYLWCTFAHIPYTAKYIGELAGFLDRIQQIDFSAAFDRIDHQVILYQLCSVYVGMSCIDTVSIKPITACYSGWLLY